MSEIVFRWSGILLLVGAALLGSAIVSLSLSPVSSRPFSPGTSTLLLLSSIFLLLSLPAVYIRQADAAGWLGVIGYGLLQTGMLFVVIIAAAPLFYHDLQQAPGESPAAFLLGIALTLGLLLTGIATVRADVFPRWVGILLLAATAGFFFDFFVAEFLPPLAGQIGSALFGILLALAFAGIGFSLWMGRPGLVAGF